MLTRLDDGLIDHDKVEEAGLKLGRNGYLIALGAFSWGVCYANKKLTDGEIPERALQRYGVTQAVADALVAVNLWERAEDGFRIHDFHDWNPTASQVKDKRTRDRERKRKAAGFSDDSTRIPRGNPPGGSTPYQTDGISDSAASRPRAYPGAPPNRDGQGRNLDLNSEGEPEREPAAPILSRSGHQRHAFCGHVCVPDFMHERFVRQSGSDEAEANTDLRAWYAEVDQAWQRRAVGDKPEEFWAARFKERTGSTVATSGTARLSGVPPGPGAWRARCTGERRHEPECATPTACELRFTRDQVGAA